MIEQERYLKITSCSKCHYYGHTYSVMNKAITIFICGNPANISIENLERATINNIHYPITCACVFSVKAIPIPKWCKLPNTACLHEPIIENKILDDAIRNVIECPACGGMYIETHDGCPHCERNDI